MEKEKQKKKRTTADIIRRVVFFIALAVFLFAAGNLIKIGLNYKHIKDVNDEVIKSVTIPVTQSEDNNPTDAEENPLPFFFDYKRAKEINGDTVGFLYIPSINLKLPVVQTDNDAYYLNHDFYKKDNLGGAIFEEYRIKNGLDASHVILYGHCIYDMFDRLDQYKKEEFYKADGNDVFYVFTSNAIHRYKIYTSYQTDPASAIYAFNFSSTETLRNWAKDRKAESFYDTGVDVSEGTQFVTLSTCLYEDTNYRIVVSGVYDGDVEINQIASGT